MTLDLDRDLSCAVICSTLWLVTKTGAELVGSSRTELEKVHFYEGMEAGGAMLTRVAPRKNEWLRRVAAERIQRWDAATTDCMGSFDPLSIGRFAAQRTESLLHLVRLAVPAAGKHRSQPVLPVGDPASGPSPSLGERENGTTWVRGHLVKNCQPPGEF